MGALRAYAGLMEHLQAHNALAAGLGQQHGRPCAIPQGCPWSMGFLEKLTEGWVELMRRHGAQAGVLADDLKVCPGGTKRTCTRRTLS